MWAFLWARLRMWLLLALVAPLVAWLLGLIGDAVEARRGPNDLSRGLQWARSWLRHRSRGPWARRAADPTGPADPGTPAR